MPEEKQAVWAKGLPGVPKAMFWPGILEGSAGTVFMYIQTNLCKYVFITHQRKYCFDNIVKFKNLESEGDHELKRCK